MSCVSALDWMIQAPKHRYALGIFPTPLHKWHPPGVPAEVEMYIKRDDLSGMQLSGNKVFLTDAPTSLLVTSPAIQLNLLC